MSTEIMTFEKTDIQITSEQTELVKQTICQGATDAEMKLFFYDCQRRGVHPLDKLIHFTKRNGKYTPVTSIDFFRQRAHTSGAYAGEDAPEFTETNGLPDACTYAVYRIVQGVRCKWTATARWKEYFPGEAQGFMWKKMPHLMLAKCAEALALRKAFPAELQGLYVNEEMDQAEPPKPAVLDHKQRAQAAIAELRNEGIKPEPQAAGHAGGAEAVQPPTKQGVTPQASDRAPAPTDDSPAFIWRVGTKHKGESIRTIPDDYLTWFAENGKAADHVQAVNDEIDRRMGQASADYGDGEDVA